MNLWQTLSSRQASITKKQNELYLTSKAHSINYLENIPDEDVESH